VAPKTSMHGGHVSFVYLEAKSENSSRVCVWVCGGYRINHPRSGLEGGAYLQRASDRGLGVNSRLPRKL
jgi:hypothetical protein